MAGDTGRLRVVVELRGRLGNQMFQYAAGRALAARLGAELALDSTATDGKEMWRGRLDPFRLGLAQVNTKRRPPPRLRDLPRWLTCRIVGKPTKWSHDLPNLKQRDFAIDERYFAWTGSCLLAGYWQSERCFAPVADRIRHDFALHRFAAERAAPVVADIESGPSVAVHVRRGDYVRLAEESYFTLCGRDYYDRARDLVEARVAAPRWFVFSDEPETARDLLGDWPGARVVAGLDEYEDMMLMARCHHHVIANSSYSWWAAWLGERTGSTVVAPRQWFAPDANIDTRDLLPARWHAV